MPKQMFFNIKKEKQEMFLNIAVSEFTTKSFEQVSVNTIVKKANISRGSFYTYFEDLESLFKYLLESVLEERFKYAKTILKKTKGDYFSFIKLLFEYDFDNYSETGKYTLFRNFIHYINTSKKGSLKSSLLVESLNKFSENNGLENVFDIEKLNVTKTEFIDIVEIVIILMINTFIKSENENLTKIEAITLFNKRISYIEYGVCKGENS